MTEEICDFYRSCAPQATAEGITSLEQQAIEDDKARLHTAQVEQDHEEAIRALQARHSLLNAMASKAAKEHRQAESDLLDEFITGDTQSLYKTLPARREALRWKYNLAVAAVSRVCEVLMPRAALERLRAQVDHLRAEAVLAESIARVFVARKLLLMKPLAEAEGSSLVTSGGLSAQIVTDWINARAKYATLAGTLRDMEVRHAEHAAKFLQ